MTLFNVDKTSDDRMQPTINAPDLQDNPMAHGTASLSPRAVGTQQQAKIVTKDSRIIGYDGANNIGLFGFDDAGNMVLKIAKPGFDANNATASQLIFNSQQDILKVAEGPYAVTITGGSVSNGAQSAFTATLNFSGTYTTPPIILAFTSVGGTTGNLFGGGAFGGTSGPLVPDAFSVSSGGGVTIRQAYMFGLAVTTTSATFKMTYMNGDTLSHTAANLSMNVYVLQESAS